MSKADEIWKDIKGFEGMYQISNLGRVRSLDRYVKNKTSNRNIKRGKILKSWILHGYELVALSKNSKNHYKRVHRLLAEAFIPKEDEKYDIVNHKDGNKSNNKIENLEWCTQKQNVQHAIKNNLWKDKKAV